MTKPVAIDLFCGAGGLSLGLKSVGFRIAAGVELDRLAARTFKLNNPRAISISGDIRTVSPWALKKDIGGRIDLLAACPPCQGFTSLTSQFRRDDPRNDLVSEVLRFAEKLRPRAVMFENVPRFATSEKGRTRFLNVIEALTSMGYRVKWSILDAADFGSAQFRKRLVVFATKAEIQLPTKSHSRVGADGEQKWRTVRDAIGHTKKATPFAPGSLTGVRAISEWHVTRRLSQLNQRRLEVAMPGGARWDLPDELRPPCHVGSNVGFKNVYCKMTWSEPSPTITGGCTSPSKGRFGHPKHARTISVREAALLQDFPDDYLIDTDGRMDRVCEMVGNAFPSRLAAAAAKQVIDIL